MPTRRKFRRNNRNKNKSRRKRQQGGWKPGEELNSRQHSPNKNDFITKQIVEFSNPIFLKVINENPESFEKEPPCPEGTKGFTSAGKRNGTDACKAAVEKGKYNDWFKNPNAGKKPVDSNWLDRNQDKPWYYKAFINVFGKGISNTIKTVIEKKREEKETDVKFIQNLDTIINSPFLKKYLENFDSFKTELETYKKKKENNAEIKKIMNDLKPKNIEDYTKAHFKNGVKNNLNYKGAIWTYQDGMSWENSWKEVIKIMNKPNVEGATPPRKGWTKEIGGNQQDPYKRKELYDTALEKFSELFKNFKKLIIHYHENKIKLLEVQAAQAEMVGNSEDEAEKTSEMNEEKKALKNIDKEMAQFKPLFIIFTYIFLPGHIWNKLNKKTDDKPGLDAYGLKESVLVHSFEELRNLSEKYKINKDEQKKDGNIIFHTDINFIDEFINVIENHFKELIKAKKDDAILQSIDTELKKMDKDGNISFFHTPKDGATIKNDLKVKTITGEEKNLAPIIKFHIIRFLRHIVQTPELEHKWCNVENNKGIRIKDLKKAKIAMFKYELQDNVLKKVNSGVTECPKKGGRKTRRRRRKRKRKKTRRRRRRRR